ncbi:hypothetical protein NE237_013157 [Protea cynaroides]|uniref:dolichyl-P-Man:Man5GlcNAc2-PP-dolichol alpha-1,3-mannosyltransferase n=1 Tax=Protea cynaroides TaxID=273540 RepID=A0A9Q0JXJ7_9MAGN|nr:hypothetical protein NE237_013157 [Protea cynaroides]
MFVLRLFNGYFAMTFLHAALALLLFQRWHLGLIIFSVAVEIKMNVLLYAPPLFVLMLKVYLILFGSTTFCNFRTLPILESSLVHVGRVHFVHGIYAGIAVADVGLSPAPGNASGIPCTFFRAGCLHQYLPHHHVVALRISPHTVSRTFAAVVGLSPAARSASGNAGVPSEYHVDYHHFHTDHAPQISPRTFSRTFVVAVGLFLVARSASGIGDTPFEDRVFGYHPHHPNVHAPQTSPHSVSRTFLEDVGLSPVARSASGIGDTPSEDHIVGYHLHHPNDAPRIYPHSVSHTFLVVVGLSTVLRSASGIAATLFVDHAGYLLPHSYHAPRSVVGTAVADVGLSLAARSASGILDTVSVGRAGYLPRQALRTFLRSVVGTVVAGAGLALPACNDAGIAGTVFADHVGSLLCHLQPKTRSQTLGRGKREKEENITWLF